MCVVDGVGLRDGGVAPAEGVGLRAGEIVTIAGCWQDKAWGAGKGCHGEWERPSGRK